MLINGTNILNLDFINNYGIINGQDYRLDDNGTDRPNIFTSNIQFSRTSSATYFDNTGVMRVTPASKNLYTWSQNFENSAWTKSGCSVAANQNPTNATLGPELWANPSNWSSSNATVTSTFPTVEITFNAFPASAWAGVITVPGRRYALSITYTGTANPAYLVSNNAANGSALYAPGTPSGAVRYFVSTQPTMFIGVDGNAGTQLSISSISVREVISGFNIAPDNTPTADTMIASAGVLSPQIQQTVATVAGTLYTASFYVRAFDWQFVQLAVNNQTSDFCNFNLTGTGTVQNNGAAVGSITFDISTGYYRISMAYTASGTDRRPILAMVPSATATRLQTRTWNGTEFNTIWGAQLEVVPSQNLVFGPELIVNGDFSSGSTGWTNSSTGTGTFTVSGGTANIVGTDGNNRGAFSQVVPFVVGRIYLVSFTALITSGAASAFGFATGIAGLPVASGTNSVYLAPSASANGGFFYTNSGGGNITIDNISAREITSILNMPTTYTSNYAGTFPPRFDYNPATRQPQGLLIEEQRTNLLTYSEQFDNTVWVKPNVTVTPNAAVSPDGTTTADKVVATNTASSTRAVYQNFTPSVTQNYAFSVYAKAAEYSLLAMQEIAGGRFGATFDLSAQTTTSLGGAGFVSSSIISVGNGWFRCSVVWNGVAASGRALTIIGYPAGTTFLSPAGTAYAGDGVSGVFIWGAQLEAGSFPTSYIPTVASQVTRTADIAQMLFPVFNQFYNQTEGTFVTEATTSFEAAPTTPFVFTVSDTTTNNRVRCLAADTSHLLVTTRGITQCDIDAGNITDNTVFKVSTAMKTDSFAASLNGGSVVTDISGTLPATMTQLNIGAAQTATTNFLNGYVRRLIYIPLRLPNNQLQALTQ